MNVERDIYAHKSPVLRLRGVGRDGARSPKGRVFPHGRRRVVDVMETIAFRISIAGMVDEIVGECVR